MIDPYLTSIQYVEDQVKKIKQQSQPIMKETNSITQPEDEQNIEKILLLLEEQTNLLKNIHYELQQMKDASLAKKSLWSFLNR